MSNQWHGPGAYPAGDAPFRAAELAGPQPFFRDELDAKRSMYRRTPDSQYPDGYLGTINPRRQDRLYGGLKAKSDSRPYGRGVHKGERLEANDYLWPDAFRMESGIAAQMEGHRFVSESMLMEAGLVEFRPPQDDAPEMNRVGIKGLPRGGTAQWSTMDKKGTLQRLGPSWSSAGPGVTTPYPGR